MATREDRSAESLWRHVVDLKYGDAGGTGPDRAGASQLSDVAELCAISETLHSALPGQEAFGRAQARMRLIEAMSEGRSARTWWRRVGARRSWPALAGKWRTSGAMVVVLLLLTAIAIAAWYRAAAMAPSECTIAPAKQVRVVGGASMPKPAACTCRGHAV